MTIKHQQNPNIEEDDIKKYYNLILHPAFFHIVDNLVPHKSIIKIMVNCNSMTTMQENKEPDVFTIHLKREVKIKNLLPQEIIQNHFILNEIQEFSEYLFLEYIDIIPKLFDVVVVIFNKDAQLFYNKIKSEYCTIFNIC